MTTMSTTNPTNGQPSYGNSACDVIALAAGSSFQSGGDGAAMWGLYMNAQNAGTRLTKASFHAHGSPYEVSV
jgi:hypothetical protein